LSDNFQKPRWVDFHCHLDLYPDHEDLIRQCDAKKIATLAITTTPKTFERNVELASKSRYVMVGLGLHPQLVAQRAGEIAMFESLLERARYVGEIGLDAASQFYASFESQQRLFERILRACDERGNKILSIHSVRSVSKVLKHVERCLRDGGCVPVMHWFTGTVNEARRAASLGCFFSVNSEMVRTEKLRPLLQALPLSRLLTETDGPFVMVDGRPTTPSDIPATVRELASLRNMDANAMAEQLVSNLRSVHEGSPTAGDNTQQQTLFS
jgi:TatD DNase family protein